MKLDGPESGWTLNSVVSMIVMEITFDLFGDETQNFGRD